MTKTQSFIAVDDVKNFLGITDTTQDASINAVLNTVVSKLDIFKKTIRTSIIPQHQIHHGHIPLPYPFVHKVKKINNQDTSGWIVLPSGEIWLEWYNPDKPYITVEYETGFDALPPEYLPKVADFVSATLAKENGKTISSETLWPRSVSYAVATGGTNNGIPDEERAINRLLTSLLPAHLRAF